MTRRAELLPRKRVEKGWAIAAPTGEMFSARIYGTRKQAVEARRRLTIWQQDWRCVRATITYTIEQDRRMPDDKLPKDRTPDYTQLEGPAFLEALGDDAMKWAVAFKQMIDFNGLFISDITPDYMVGWFANAIEHSGDVRRRAMSAPALEALRWILPMAKGFAHEHPVGRNVEIVRHAEEIAALGQAAGTREDDAAREMYARHCGVSGFPAWEKLRPETQAAWRNQAQREPGGRR